MINLEEELKRDTFPAEMREFLRQTLPNQGFYFLLDTAVLRINQDLQHLNTSCTDAEFRQKYDKLLLEREIYTQLKRVAEELAITNEES